VTSENVLIEQATELIGATLNPDNFGVFLVDQDKGVLRKHLTYRRIQAGNAEGGGGGTLQLGEGICGLVAERGQSWRISDVRLEPAYKVINPRIRSELCVPIKVGERVIGVVNAESAQLDAFTEAEEQLLETFAAQLATAIEKVRLFEEVQRLAITDSLTGLYNRRHFFELAGREYQRARRYKRPLTAVMLDLDHFKNVNDTHGHATGDQVLESLAMICKNELREIDILGRYGGEEFCVLLPESNLLDARKVATRLCQRIQETTFETDRTSVKITISLGIAELDSTCKDLDELLNRADVALYTAKQQGRNRVRVFASVLS
jgi:diguanylate cyclase (GGDEF)-like protein